MTDDRIVKNPIELAVKDTCWVAYDRTREPYLCGLVRDLAHHSLATATIDKAFGSKEEAIVWADSAGLKVLGVGDFLDKYAKYYAHHMQWDG